MSDRLLQHARVQTFRYAFRGLATLLATQSNARIHALATIAVVGLGLWLGLARLEWLALVLTIGAVWSFEAMNTAIEAICDLVSPDPHPLVERAKDVAAAAVLVAALAALAVAALVFGPRLLG